MRNILVIRFGALGDLCVLGWSLARLADHGGDNPGRITLVTKEAFAPLLSDFAGVHEVICLKDNSLRGVSLLAAELRRRHWDVVLDAHNTLRSHALLGFMGRRADARLAKDTAARLRFMFRGRRASALDQRMLDRFQAVVDQVTGAAPPPRENPPLAGLKASRTISKGSDGPVIGIAPGAQWDTKRWPESHYSALLGLIRARSDHRIRIYLGPREAAWYPDSSLAAAALEISGVEVFSAMPLPEVARSLSELAVLVTNDSGLLHLAEAVATPVLGFYGPTVREFGYFPVLKGSRVLERNESCRPCSRNGKRPCHRRDLACLERIAPDEAFESLQEMLAEGSA